MERLLGNQEEQNQSGRSNRRCPRGKETPSRDKAELEPPQPVSPQGNPAPQALFPAGGRKRAARGCGKRGGLRWQVLGSSEPPALLLSQDHLHIRVLLLLEAPVGAVVTVRTAGRAEGREENRENQLPAGEQHQQKGL